MTHLVGQQLGRYTVEEEIGRGGMARVYRALDTLLKRTVALKVLAPQLAVDPEFAQRFEREAVTAANLRHPNIVTIYDVGEHNGMRYIAMEYVRGRTLHAIIDEHGALGLSYAIAIVGAVAAALDYAHNQGAVHRDIKPQNIMIDVEGRVLLTDFGIAQAPEAANDQRRLTRTGIFMGTPEYISPEQASAQRVDGRSDLYSLGIATYEIITGAVPFSGATPQLIVAHAQKTPPPLSAIDPTQPAELDLVMARILAKRPENRFASGAGLVEALRTVARKHGIAVATPRQLAGLAATGASSAGGPPILHDPGPVPRGPRAPVLPLPNAGSSNPTQIGPTPPRPVGPARPADPTMPARARPVTPPPRLEDEDDWYGPPDTRGRGRPPLPEPPDDQGGGNRGPWVIAGLLGGLFLVFLFVILRGGLPSAGPNVTPTRPPVPSTIPTIETDTPTPPPTLTPVPTATPVPVETPTAVQIQATAEPVLQPQPTRRPTRVPPPPTETPPVEPTVEPSPTDLPPTAIPLPTEVPTATLSPTPLPPTATATSPPSPTATPTPTIDVVSPSPSATATASFSPLPTSVTTTATATATPTPTAETPTATQAPTEMPSLTPLP